jgi:hypothetical protein
MKEIFKDIPNYEGVYRVSNTGKIQRIFKGGRIKDKKLTKSNTGYLVVHLSLNGKSKVFEVHQLVAMAFLNHIPDGHKFVVDHINNNPLDNRVENLQIILSRVNTSKDRKNCSSKFTGVTWHKVAEKWVVQIQNKDKREYLGLYEDELEASIAYKKRLNEILIKN